MNSVFILFPNEPFTPGTVDSEFNAEYEAARLVGFPTGFYDHELVERSELVEALDTLPRLVEPQKGILRGWILPRLLQKPV